MEQSRKELCGVILAGGQSSRMGRRKELLAWEGETLIEHLVGCVRQLSLPCLVVTNEPQLLPPAVQQAADVQVSSDAVESCGPLGGIITAMRVRPEEKLLLLSCDLPFVTPGELASLCAYQSQVEEWDVLLTQSQNRLHPLLGLYRRQTQPVWEEAFASKQFRLMAVLDKLRVQVAPESLLDPWTTYNANTPEEYERALAHWQLRHKA